MLHKVNVVRCIGTYATLGGGWYCWSIRLHCLAEGDDLMNKILAYSILGMALTGAVMIISVPLLFNNPIGNVLEIVIAGSSTAIVIFAISILVFRRRLDEQAKKEDN